MTNLENCSRCGPCAYILRLPYLQSALDRWKCCSRHHRSRGCRLGEPALGARSGSRRRRAGLGRGVEKQPTPRLKPLRHGPMLRNILPFCHASSSHSFASVTNRLLSHTDANARQIATSGERPILSTEAKRLRYHRADDDCSGRTTRGGTWRLEARRLSPGSAQALERHPPPPYPAAAPSPRPQQHPLPPPTPQHYPPSPTLSALLLIATPRPTLRPTIERPPTAACRPTRRRTATAG